MKYKVAFWVHQLKRYAEMVTDFIECLNKKDQNIFYTMRCIKGLADSSRLLAECVFAFIKDVEGR